MSQNYQTTTSQLGIVVPSTGCPDYHVGVGGQLSPDAMLAAAVINLESRIGNVEVDSASGAIASTYGTVFITKAGVAAMTLAKPIAGLPSAGGHDGQQLEIISTTANAHTVTTPSNGINGAHVTLTFTAAVGTNVILTAYNGTWYVNPSTPGITIS